MGFPDKATCSIRKQNGILYTSTSCRDFGPPLVLVLAAPLIALFCFLFFFLSWFCFVILVVVTDPFLLLGFPNSNQAHESVSHRTEISMDIDGDGTLSPG